MKITNISGNSSFGQWLIQGKDSDDYKKLLKPYEKKLDRLTDGYDVTIVEKRGPFQIYNSTYDESHTIYGIPVVTIKPISNAGRIVPQLKLYVYPGAGEMQTKAEQAREMIRVIQKGISFYA